MVAEVVEPAVRVFCFAAFLGTYFNLLVYLALPNKGRTHKCRREKERENKYHYRQYTIC